MEKILFLLDYFQQGDKLLSLAYQNSTLRQSNISLHSFAINFLKLQLHSTILEILNTANYL